MMKKRLVMAALTAALLGTTSSAPAALIEYNFNLDPQQSVPPNSSPAVGSAQLIYDTASMTFDLDLVVFGIDIVDLLNVGPNSTPVHIHLAPAGSTGPIVVDLGFFGSFVPSGQGIRLQLDDVLLGGQQGGIFSDPVQNEAALFAGDLYVNIHTTTYPGGEIRGQIVPAPGAMVLLGLAALGVSPRRRRSGGA